MCLRLDRPICIVDLTVAIRLAIHPSALVVITGLEEICASAMFNISLPQTFISAAIRIKVPTFAVLYIVFPLATVAVPIREVVVAVAFPLAVFEVTLITVSTPVATNAFTVSPIIGPGTLV